MKNYIGLTETGDTFPIRTHFGYVDTYHYKTMPSLHVFDGEGFYRFDTRIGNDPRCYVLYRNTDIGLFIATNLQFLMDSTMNQSGVHMTNIGMKKIPVTYRKIEPLELMFL